MFYMIQEMVDGRLFLVVLDEGYRFYGRGIMDGGFFEYNGKIFVKMDFDILGRWFLMSYILFGGESVIVGIIGGFVEFKGNWFIEFDEVEDVFYFVLCDVQLVFYLGMKGVKFGDDVWLFGSVGGIVGYCNGIWFYLDCLNWIFFVCFYVNYGVCMIYVVEMDFVGWVYVVIDWGLIVYDFDGVGVEFFFILERCGDFVFFVFE